MIVGNAPSRMRSGANCPSPSMMSTPRFLAPANAVSVVMPMRSTDAVRTPLTMSGSASGISTRMRSCPPLIPMPSPASTAAGSTPESPT
jgi:hypothetical protein